MAVTVRLKRRSAEESEKLAWEHGKAKMREARRTGVRTPRKKWNKEQDAWLGEIPDEVVARGMGRSVGAVKSRRKKL
jgi:hypothetical protein